MKLLIISIVLMTIFVGVQPSNGQIRDFNKIEGAGWEYYLGAFEPIDRDLNYDEVKGSPYLDDELIRGFIKINNNDSVMYFLRYDMYSDEMEYLQDKKLFTILKPQIQGLNYVGLSGNKFVYKEFYINNHKLNGYLIQLVTDHCSLYQRRRVEFQAAKPPEGYQEETPPQFNTLPVQWLYACDLEPINSFKPNNAGLKKIGGQYYDQLKTYMKANHLKITNEKDLIVLFEYYNSLL